MLQTNSGGENLPTDTYKALPDFVFSFHRNDNAAFRLVSKRVLFSITFNRLQIVLRILLRFCPRYQMQRYLIKFSYSGVLFR